LAVMGLTPRDITTPMTPHCRGSLHTHGKRLLLCSPTKRERTMGLPQPEETATWSDADYFAYDAVNASAIKQFAKSPKAYGHYLQPTRKDLEHDTGVSHPLPHL